MVSRSRAHKLTSSSLCRERMTLSIQFWEIHRVNLPSMNKNYALIRSMYVSKTHQLAKRIPPTPLLPLPFTVPLTLSLPTSFHSAPSTLTPPFAVAGPLRPTTPPALLYVTSLHTLTSKADIDVAGVSGLPVWREGGCSGRGRLTWRLTIVSSFAFSTLVVNMMTFEVGAGLWRGLIVLEAKGWILKRVLIWTMSRLQGRCYDIFNLMLKFEV